MVDGDEGDLGPRESWWHRHGLTVFILVLAGAISLVIRDLWAYQLIPTCNISYCYAGGSDSFYHSRVMSWIIENHNNLVHDPELNYPLGAVNPREPLFDWMNAILGILLAPFFGGNAQTAAMWVLEVQPPVWAAIGVVPVYLLGKELSSRRMGLMAALLYPLVVGNIESTVVTYANYLPFYTFFVLMSLYTFYRAIKLSGTRRWVESYTSPRSIWNGMKSFVREEEGAVKWAVMAGVTFGATMLAWQGYTLVVVIDIGFLAVMLLVERVKRADTFGAYLLTLLIGVIGFLMAMPYYYVQGEFGYWFSVPILLYFGGLLILLPFLLMRDTPWVVSIPVFLGSLAAGAGTLYLYSPAYFNAVLTGQGYFVKNLIFSTVAEAQAPSFDSLIVSYGVATFLLTFVGLAMYIAYLFIYRFRREHVFMVLFGLLSIYLPISAAKFFLLGSPIFVLLPAETLVLGLDRIGGYPQLRRNVSNLSDRGGRLMALRRSFKVRHIILGLVVVLVVLPNVSWAVDSGIPYNVQSQYSQQIYNSLPSVLQTSPSNATSFYLGIGGIDTDTPQQYDEAGYNWLATQDTFEPPADRPALVSWWDYGFQTIDEGQHPAVADNFQNGIDPSGNFLLAQNESNAIAVLATDLLVSEATASGNPYLPSALDAELRADGVNMSELHNFMINTTGDISTVLANQNFGDGYGTHDAANLDAENAEYDTVAYLLSSTLSENMVVKVYQDLQDFTGWSIRYAMADTRLFPTSGSNTGIYYAPVDLTDGVISSGGIPTSYFTVTVTGTDGNTYQLGDVPAGVGEASSQINYNAPFYNSMIYKIEEGYNGTDIGAGTGIPGLTLSDDNPEPGWMMQHFVMVYRTAYWCPYTDYQAHPNCFEAVNSNTAEYYDTTSNGTADLSATSYFDSGGETILAYYPGATINGQVMLPGDIPVAGARVTILDSWGTPHMTEVTGANGQFSLIAPPGNDSVIVSYGALNGLTMTGATQVGEYNVTVRADQAYWDDPTPITTTVDLRPASLTGLVYWNLANTSTYSSPKDQVIQGATVTVSNGLGLSRSVETDASGTYVFGDLPPGSYNLTLQVGSTSTSEGSVSLGSGYAVTQNEGIGPTGLQGQVRGSSGQLVAGAVVTLTGPSYSSSQIVGTTGNYTFAPLLPGNYSLSASSGETRSTPLTVHIATFTTNLTQNLSLVTPVRVAIQPTINGVVLPNFPVRVEPLQGTNGSSAVYLTGPTGWVQATLTPGNWSVYAYGAVNDTYVAGLSDLSLTAGDAQDAVPVTTVLTLGRAEPLTGTVYPAASSTGQSGVVVQFEDSAGDVLQSTTNGSGRFSVYLPEGPYAITANSSGSGTSEAVLSGIDLTAPSNLALKLSDAENFVSQIGFVSANGAFESIPNLPVTLNRVQGNVTLRLVTSTSGGIVVTLPEGSDTYRLSTSEFGFAPFRSSPLTLDELVSDLGQVELNISTVPVHVLVLNSTAAAATPIFNLTAISDTAVSVINTSSTNETVDLYPGTYLVSAWAPEIGGGRLHPYVNTTLVVPVGSVGIDLNITLYGTLRYVLNLTTSGLNLASDKVLLVGAPGTYELNGSALLTGFTAPPGTYNLWVTTSNGSQPYAYFDPITLWRNGTTSPKNMTLVPAASMEFTLEGAFGASVNATLEFRISNGNGTYGTFETGTLGNATLLLPRGGYNFTLPDGYATVLLDRDGITQYWNLTVNSSAETCAANPYGTSICDLHLLVVRAIDHVTGDVAVGSTDQLGAYGTVTVIPEDGVDGYGTQVFPVTQGAYNLSLLPGRYTLYTVIAPDGSPEVNITQLVILYSAKPIPMDLQLSPGWTQTVVLSPARGLPDPGKTTLVFTHVGGFNVTLANVTIGSPFRLILPSGAWTLQANATVSPYGAAVNLLAEANVTVRASNAYLDLPLVPQWIKTVSLKVVGKGTPVVEDGQSIAYELVVNDTGNAPLLLRLTGSPSTWKISMSPSNFTLGPAVNNRSQAIEVYVTVPAGTLTSSAPLTFQVVPQTGGSYLAEVSPPLTIAPQYLLSATADTSTNAVGQNSLVLGFTLSAEGNTAESATISVGNAAQLTQDGWTYVLSSSTGTVVTGPQSLTPQAAPFDGEVQLFARAQSPILPSSVAIYAVDASHPTASASVVLGFPSKGTLGLNSSVVVTGPNLGSGPAPAWEGPLYVILVFVPGAVILAAAGTWRWWRTRQWVRR